MTCATVRLAHRRSAVGQRRAMLDRIRASLPALPPAEQRVAKLVLADPRSFASLPVGELAERAHVSKPTVVRFCRSVGYDGLADFKLKLAGSVNEGVPFVHRAVDEDDKAGDIIVKVIDNAVSALLKYRNDAAGHAFERAIDALADGRPQRAGASSSTASAIRASWRRTRSTSSSAWASTPPPCSDGHVQVMSATMLQPGDCAVIISNSGRSRDLLDAADIARKKGATTDRHHRQRLAAGADGATAAQQIAAGRRPPGGLRPLQPDGVAPAAPGDHRHPDHRRGAAAGRRSCGRCCRRSRATCARSATRGLSATLSRLSCRPMRARPAARPRRTAAPARSAWPARRAPRSACPRPAPGAALEQHRERRRVEVAQRRRVDRQRVAASSRCSACASMRSASRASSQRQRLRQQQHAPAAALGRRRHLVALGQLGDQAIDAAGCRSPARSCCGTARPARRRAR